MVYLLTLCAPSFVLSLVSFAFGKKSATNARSYWLTGLFLGLVPMPFLSFMMLFGASLMRDETPVTWLWIIGVFGILPLIFCLIGIGGAAMIGLIKQSSD